MSLNLCNILKHSVLSFFEPFRNIIICFTAGVHSQSLPLCVDTGFCGFFCICIILYTMLSYLYHLFLEIICDRQDIPFIDRKIPK